MTIARLPSRLHVVVQIKRPQPLGYRIAVSIVVQIDLDAPIVVAHGAR